MTDSQAKSLIKNLRRQVFFANAGKWLVLGVLLVSVVAAIVTPLLALPDLSDSLWTLTIFCAGCWLVMSVIGYRQIRAANQAAIYIATGRLDLAETHLRDAVLAFNPQSRGKLLACHNLAVVTHGRKDYDAAATLCDGIISLGARQMKDVIKLCRILLADCLLETDDACGALEAIAPLRDDEDQLSLDEKLLLLPIQLRCDVACGQFESIIDDLPGKIRKAEMLDAPKAGLCHAILATACDHLKRPDEASYLRERAKLYHDVDLDVLQIPLASDAAK